MDLIRQDISRRTEELTHLDIYKVDLTRHHIYNQHDLHIGQN